MTSANQHLFGALRAPRTAMRSNNKYEIRVWGRIAVQHFAALVVLLVLAAAPAGAAAEPSTRDEVAELSAALMSPFCPGLLLANCPSSDAQALRREIAARIEKGESRASIEHDLIARYGEAILSAPRPRGIGIIAWLLPAAFGALALGVASITVRRAVARGRQSQAPAASYDAELAARIDAELHDLD